MTLTSFVRRFALVVAVMTAVTVCGNGIASAVTITSPVVKVSPSTGLVDLQNVTMTGARFGADAAVDTIECSTATFSPTTCDVGTLVSVVADKHGTFTLKRYVRRVITLELTTTSRTVDCAIKVGCTLVALTTAPGTQPSAAIFFNPKVPPKVPTITVTPNTKLVDHQLVTVTGKNFAPSSAVFLAECVTGLATTENGSPCDDATQQNINVDRNGAFTATNVVLERRQIVTTNTNDLTVDCAAAPNTCDLQTFPSPFGLGFPSTASTSAKAALTFDPTVPFVVAAVHATPASQLGDMQSITVTGTGFTPSASVSVEECASTSFIVQACTANIQSVTANFQGGFSLTFAVRREITPAFTATGTTTVDCATAPDTCELTAQGTQSQPSATVGLSFNPKLPAVAETITASPHTGLHDNQTLTVSLHGFTPNEPVQIVECSAQALTEPLSSAYCDANTTQTATPAGPNTLDASFAVHAVIGGQGGIVNCATRPGTCILTATETNNSDLGIGDGFGIITATIGPDQSDLVYTPLTFTKT